MGREGQGWRRDADRRGCNVILLFPLRNTSVVVLDLRLPAARLSQSLSVSCSSLTTILC